MLRVFGHPGAMCCDMLGVVGSSLKMVTFEPTTPNTSQQEGHEARNMFRQTMLRYVALACCDRLAGAYRAGKQVADGKKACPDYVRKVLECQKVAKK